MPMSRFCNAVVIACLVAGAGLSSGCSSLGSDGLKGLKQQYRRAIEGMKADAAIMDSSNDGLDAFGSNDAAHLRNARAELER